MKTLHLRPKQAALLGIALLFTPAAAQAQQMVLAGGLKDGLYDHLTQGISSRLEDSQRPSVRIVPTLDYAESLEWIADQGEGAKDEVRFAFIRQDMMGDHFRKVAETPVRVVGRVAYEYLHIIVRESLHVESPTDLARRRIWVGEDRSALKFTARHVLDSLGVRLEQPLTYRDLENWEPGEAWVEDYAIRKLPDWLASGMLDAAVIMAPAGSPEISAMTMRGRCSLLPLDRGTLRRLLAQRGAKDDPFLRHIALGAIPPRSYFNQAEALSTVAVPLLLVTRTGTDPKLAMKVLDAARQEWDSVGANMTRHQDWEAPTAPWKPESLPQSGLKLLDGIRWKDPLRDQILIGMLLALSGIVVILLVPRTRWFRQGTRRIRSLWHHYPLLFSATLPLIVGMVIITWLIYFAERDINENFSTPWESWWSITIYIFSGLEDRVPYTVAGHIIVTLGLLLGAICSAVFTGWTTAFFVRRERKMPRKLEGHCLLLNWNERGTELVRELHHPVLRRFGRTSVIVVLADDPGLSLHAFKQSDHPLEEAFEEVYLRPGDPTDATALRQANAASAHTVIILANEKHGDERTIRSILQLRRIALAAGRDDLHVVAELIDAANDFTVEELASDFPGSLESVSGLRLRTCLLSQAALSEGIIGVYKDLLSVEDGTNEVYTAPIPSEAVGMRFHEYAATVLRKSAEGSPIIPIGIQRRLPSGKAELMTNPRAGKHGTVLQEKDQLVLIAYGPPGEEALPLPEAPPRADRLTGSAELAPVR